MLSWLLSVAGQALGRLLGSSGNISNTDVRDATASLWASLKGIADFLTKLLGNELGAWQFAHPHIVGGGWGIGQLAYNEAQAWQKLLETIIPNSLSWLDGRTHQWVDAKYDPFVAWVYGEVRGILGWESVVGKELNDWAFPHIRAWIGFRTWFNTWPQGILFRWQDYFANPHHFADWAATPLIGPLVSYLAQPEHKQTRDNLMQIVVDATADSPIHVEAAATEFLLSQGW